MALLREKKLRQSFILTVFFNNHLSFFLMEEIYFPLFFLFWLYHQYTSIIVCISLSEFTENFLEYLTSCTLHLYLKPYSWHLGRSLVLYRVRRWNLKSKKDLISGLCFNTDLMVLSGMFLSWVSVCILYNYDSLHTSQALWEE